MQKNRIAYIDQIKVFLTCLVVAHHAAQAYGPTGGVWVVDDPHKASWLRHFFFVNAAYMMGLYFFISGYFMVFSIQRKTNAAFAKDRLKRLGIPLAFFTLLVFLPFNYFGAGGKGNILQFLATTYLERPPIATGHLWFVASLLAYSFLYLIFFHQRFTQVSKQTQPISNTYIFLYVAALTLVSAWVRQYYPIDTWKTWIIPLEPAHLPQYLSLFIAGTLFNHANWLNRITGSQGILFFAIAVITYAAQAFAPASIKEFWITESLVESLLCVGISIGLLSFFRRWGNNMNGFIASLSENAYGIYLVHLFIVIIFQQLLLGWQANPTIKFIVVTFLGILTSLGVSILIRKNKTVRSIV
ncbi:acyltransferase [Flavihumibacter rivuli]|uniref:acyltransferase n=1 Tax=Flavihumibacter rivuli TaxID=2838156 RepID=UPI001BDF2E60|nr:acyltransferase [Flavihumibacter rivuli]ULQ55905.1 acyltransferase [Flavihumibacter rivuli]